MNSKPNLRSAGSNLIKFMNIEIFCFIKFLSFNLLHQSAPIKISLKLVIKPRHQDSWNFIVKQNLMKTRSTCFNALNKLLSLFTVQSVNLFFSRWFPVVFHIVFTHISSVKTTWKKKANMYTRTSPPTNVNKPRANEESNLFKWKFCCCLFSTLRSQTVSQKFCANLLDN